jgi:nucleolar GTP-binding protein
MGFRILPESKELLDIAFRKARKQSKAMKRQNARIKDAKSRAIKQVEVASGYVAELLYQTAEEFPSFSSIKPFYRELIECTIDVDKTLKALGHMSAERRIIERLRGQHIGRIKGLEKENAEKAREIVKEFYGRLSGLVKKLDKSLKAYNQAARKLRELPSIKPELDTIILAGYPNTGKSTILNRLTKSTPKVAPYPFTTQKLQIGYLIHNYRRVQLIDTPGLLDRPFGERNSIEKKAIAALRHLAKLIVFVVDPTGGCGFPLEKQAALLKELETRFQSAKFLVVLNKADLASERQINEAKGLFGEALLDGEGIETGLKEKILGKL